jgi:hypothetical protein
MLFTKFTIPTTLSGIKFGAIGKKALITGSKPFIRSAHVGGYAFED